MWTIDMKNRINMLLNAYDITFPIRPMKQLNSKELSELKQTVLELL